MNEVYDHHNPKTNWLLLLSNFKRILNSFKEKYFVLPGCSGLPIRNWLQQTTFMLRTRRTHLIKGYWVHWFSYGYMMLFFFPFALNDCQERGYLVWRAFQYIYQCTYNNNNLRILSYTIIVFDLNLSAITWKFVT